MSANARKLSSMDASFLYLKTPETPMHVGSMAIFRLKDGCEGDFFEELKAMIAERLHIAPILKSRLAKTPLDIDHPSWVEDEQFDIDRHIFRASLPAPHDRAMLERTVGWMHAKLLSRARPLWEFYVFEGMRKNGQNNRKRGKDADRTPCSDYLSGPAFREPAAKRVANVKSLHWCQGPIICL
jgi:diacylglycerol O-acyltransferase